jgi:hypothetical protein
MKMKLTTIETEEAEKNFKNLIEGNLNKTFFLNGVWGSGKTEFLNKVEKKSVYKFKILDVWSKTDSRSVLEQSFALLKPIVYWSIKLLIVAAVVVSILFSKFLNIDLIAPLTKLMNNSLLGLVIIVICLMVAVYQFFRVKGDSIYLYLFKEDLVSLKNKVLIIDDFDRINKQDQLDSYKLFNVLKGKLPIVFVGDFSELIKSEDVKYLQKIIDLKVDLPYVLESNYIWTMFSEEFQKGTGQPFNETLLSLINKERRTLRDRAQFTQLLNREIFDYQKNERVQLSQLVVIDYLYLFYPNMYSRLKDSSFFEDLESESDEPFKKLKLPRELLKTLEILKSVDGFPRPFRSDKTRYYVYESINNLSVSQAKSIFENKNKLITYLNETEKNRDFSEFLKNNWNTNTFLDEQKKTATDAAIDLARKGIRTDLVNFVILMENEKIMPQKKVMIDQSNSRQIYYSIPSEWEGRSENEIRKIRFNCWNDELKSKDFDLSEIIRFLESFHLFSFKELGMLIKNISLEDEELSKVQHTDQLILIYLSQKDIFYKPEQWSRNLWNLICELNIYNFIKFWRILGYIRGGIYSNSFEILKKIPDYENSGINMIDTNKQAINCIEKKLQNNKLDYIFV